ncbi:MAG: hypothetical protein ACYC61_27875, partial [Isosphaeraceae bacterium]
TQVYPAILQSKKACGRTIAESQRTGKVCPFFALPVGLAGHGGLEHDGDRGGEGKGSVSSGTEQPDGDDCTDSIGGITFVSSQDAATPPNHCR